ncbi:MAG: hypothetical protein HY319_09530 [Armatimonadetes bacterium]|nr:hypothetical protein [Armatimonadota bacterium]
MSNLLSNVMGHAAQSTGLSKMVPGTQETERSEIHRTPVDLEEARPKRTGPKATNAGQAGASQNKKKLVRRRVVKTKAGKTNTGYRTGNAETQPKQPETAPKGPRQQPRTGGEGALWRLNSQASVNRASLNFDQSQDTTQRNVDQSRRGDQKLMLNRLVNMVEISMAQHTGGKAGEAYPRRETRQIYSALMGLKTSSPERREDRRVRHTTAELKFKETQARGLVALLEPEPIPKDYQPVSMVA